MRHVPALDALRGIAIVLVLAGHAGLLPGGWLGVDLFFVLSGFLITSLLIGEHRTTGHVSLQAFYRRRALRLFPALVVVLAVYLLLGGQLLAVLIGVTYVMNIALAAGVDVRDDMHHLWSLAAEEQFYVLWPPLLVVVLLLGWRPRSLVAGLALLAAASAGWRAALSDSTSVERLAFAPDTHADPILLGCLAGVFYSYGYVSRVPSWVVAFAMTSGIMLVGLLSIDELPRFGGIGVAIFASSSAVVVLACVLDATSWFTRVVNHRPLRYVGRISYGLYLWHLPLFWAFGWLAGTAAAFLAAAVSYRYVESPFLRRKHRVHNPTTETPTWAMPAAERAVP